MEKLSKYIDSCFKHVEQRFGKGPAHAWDTNDFDELSKAIQQETGALLSVSTLKRLSGTVHYASRPNKATLDTLAKYIHYPDWRTFTDCESEQMIKKTERIKGKIPEKYAILFSLLVLAFLPIAYWSFNFGEVNYDSTDFAFSGESVTNGLPNSVVFKYNATAADDKAKIKIQQDWDESKRILVNKNDSVATSIYYRPGLFQSKLVVDGKTVKEKDILISTLDWVGLIETDSIPVYLDKEDYYRENGLYIRASALKKYGVDPRAARTPVGFYQIRDFGDLYTTDFEITTSIRNDFRSGKSICQSAQLVIVHEDGPLSIMLTDKGCISDIMLHAFGRTIDGKNTDLSGFGVDFTDFVELTCISKNGELEILLDGKNIFSVDVPDEPKKIVGCSIHFEGAGTVQKIEFKNENRLVYSASFLDFGII